MRIHAICAGISPLRASGFNTSGSLAMATVQLALFAVVGLLVALQASSTFAAVPVLERTALVQLYNSTNGDNWVNADGWLEGDPCMDRWFGVDCDTALLHVTGLYAPHVLTAAAIMSDPTKELDF